LSPNATYQFTHWESSNPGIAKVDCDGRVTGVKEGTATITAFTYDHTFSQTCTVTVIPLEINSVTLNKTELFLIVGEEESLHATVEPYFADNDTKWISSKTSVATVTNGLVKAMWPGKATITVTAGDGFTKSWEVTANLKAFNIENETVDMAWVDGGSFQMGKNLGTVGSDTTPVHTVTLTGFYMGKYEVTQSEWEEVMGSLPSSTSNTFVKGPGYPVYFVSWFDALVFCNRLSVMEGLSPAYSISGSTNPDDWGAVPTNTTWGQWINAVMVSGSNGYRLPTEAQWEYAAKGGNNPGNYSFAGSDDYKEVGWYNENAGSKTHEIGLKLPNGLGFYDMSGNVAEWCWDRYGIHSSAAVTDPTEPASVTAGNTRIIRGGGYNSIYKLITERDSKNPYVRDIYGFRVARPAQ